MIRGCSEAPRRWCSLCPRSLALAPSRQGRVQMQRSRRSRRPPRLPRPPIRRPLRRPPIHRKAHRAPRFQPPSPRRCRPSSGSARSTSKGSLVILPLSADSTQKYDVCALQLDRQPHLGLHLEVGRGAVLDRVDDGEMPEVEGQIHSEEVYPKRRPILKNLSHARSTSNPFLSATNSEAGDQVYRKPITGQGCFRELSSRVATKTGGQRALSSRPSLQRPPVRRDLEARHPGAFGV